MDVMRFSAASTTPSLARTPMHDPALEMASIAYLHRHKRLQLLNPLPRPGRHLEAQQPPLRLTLLDTDGLLGCIGKSGDISQHTRHSCARSRHGVRGSPHLKIVVLESYLRDMAGELGQ